MIKVLALRTLDCVYTMRQQGSPCQGGQVMSHANGSSAIETHDAEVVVGSHGGIAMFFNWTTITSLLGILGWLIAIAMLFIVPVNRKPSSATAWLLLIFLLPYFGLILFLLLGSPKLPKRRRTEQHNMSELISKAMAEAKTQPELAPILEPEIPPRYAPFINLNTNLTSMPVIGGNAIELLPEYNAVFARIAQDIDSAQRFVHVEYFATSRDEETEVIFAAMDRAASRGVKVRVLMDHLGSRKYPAFKEMQERLRLLASSITSRCRCTSSERSIHASICVITARSS